MLRKSTKDKRDIRGRVPLNKPRNAKPNGEEPKNGSIGNDNHANHIDENSQQLNVKTKEVFSDLGLDVIGLPTYKFASVSSKSKDVIDSFLVQALDYATENENVIPFFTGSLEVPSYADYIKASQNLSGPSDLAQGDDGVINLSARSR